MSYRLRKGTYAHQKITDVEGIEIDYSLEPPRPSITSLPQNGFVDRDNSIISFDEGTRTLSIAPVADEYYVWTGGKQYKKTILESLVIPDVEGLHYTIFNSEGVLECTTTFDFENIIVDNALVSAMYWSITDQEAVILADERHLRMDAETHGYLHQSFGTQWISGLALANIDADQNGNLDSHAQLSVNDGVIRDEDIQVNIVNGSPQVLSTIAEIPMLYRNGTLGDWRKIDATDFPVTTTGSGRAAWNELTGGSWQLTEVTNNDFVLTHLFATSDLRHPIIGIVGQEDYATKGQAEAGAQVEINNLTFGGLSLLTPEFKPIATVIYQTGVGKTNQVKSSIETTEDGSDYVDWRTTGVGSGGTAAPSSSHPDLINRDLADQHPTTAITDFQPDVEDIVNSVMGISNLQLMNGGHNDIQNSSFYVWDKGSPIVDPTTLATTANRWKSRRVGLVGGSFSISRFAEGYVGVTFTNPTSFWYFIQPVLLENTLKYANNKGVLSLETFLSTTGSATTVDMTLEFVFNGVSYKGPVETVPIDGSTWQRVTFVTPDLPDVLPTVDGVFWITVDDPSNGLTVRFRNVSMCPGDELVIPIQRSIEEERTLCSRYYRLENLSVNWDSTSSTRMSWYLPCPGMIQTPTTINISGLTLSPSGSLSATWTGTGIRIMAGSVGSSSNALITGNIIIDADI